MKVLYIDSVDIRESIGRSFSFVFIIILFVCIYNFVYLYFITMNNVLWKSEYSCNDAACIMI